MKTISLVINLDTRKGWLEDTTEEQQGFLAPGFSGTRSLDFLTDGVECKRRFFHNLPLEVILYIDVHEPLPAHVLETLHGWQRDGKVDQLLFARHQKTWKDDFLPTWQDINYLHALTLARGSYVAHFDADVAAFSPGQETVREWIDMLDDGRASFVSYPSRNTPGPVVDGSFDYWWASTRFFITKRENLEDHTEIRRCLIPGDHLYRVYGDRQRKCPWMEHVLGIMADHATKRRFSVHYPALDYRKAMIWSWRRYRRGLYASLMGMTYPQVVETVERWGGIGYPCDVMPG